MTSRRKKDEKPIPPVGVGSKVIALSQHVRRHIVPITYGRVNGFELRFSTTSARALPEEIYKNEEIMNTARYGSFI